MQQGLTETEAQKRLATYGYNEVLQKPESFFERLFRRLRNPIFIMIECAAVLSFLLGSWVDFGIIIALLLVNIGVDLLQEQQASRVIATLQKKLAAHTTVLRDGVFKKVPIRNVVPGDVVRLGIGDIIPADAHLLEGPYLDVDQSSVTVESLPVSKQVGDEVYGNTIVSRGSMLAEVTATGIRASYGKTIALVRRAAKESVSHFQRAVQHIGHFIILITSVLAVSIVIVSVYRHDPILETLHFVLILVIASIPVALPAVLSVAMAVGALAISKHKAVVRNIAAIEELASVDVACVDKTGTLTQNVMTMKEPVAYYDFSINDVCTFAVLASRKEDNDPIETPIFKYFSEHVDKAVLSPFSMASFIPFDPVQKYTLAEGMRGEEHVAIMKGAPRVVLEHTGDIEAQEKATEKVDAFARDGYRTLAVAVRFNSDQHYTLIGLLPFFDPPREDAKEVVQAVRDNGVQVKVLTGDHHAIAVQIATLLSLPSEHVVNTRELRTGNAYKDYTRLAEIVARGVYQKLGNNVTDEAAAHFGTEISRIVERELEDADLKGGHIQKHESDIIALIEESDVFCEVLPEDKYLIVSKLQQNGHIVAMTGDGVNDAPALEKADVGIAVSGATEAARAAADMVLLSPGLHVLHRAIDIARMTFERMKGYATFRIAETIRIVFFIALSILIFNEYPVSAVMLVMLALLNDIPVMMIAYDNAPVEKKAMRWNMREVFVVAFVLGIAGVSSSFLLFYWLHSNAWSFALIQTVLFLKFDVAGHSTLYLTRTGKHHFWHKPFPSLKFFLPAFGTRIIGTLLAVYGIFMEPIGWKVAALVWIYALVWWVCNDFLKVYTYKILDKNAKVDLQYRGELAVQ